jgi:hypothetical protein
VVRFYQTLVYVIKSVRNPFLKTEDLPIESLEPAYYITTAKLGNSGSWKPWGRSNVIVLSLDGPYELVVVETWMLIFKISLRTDHGLQDFNSYTMETGPCDLRQCQPDLGFSPGLVRQILRAAMAG